MVQPRSYTEIKGSYMTNNFNLVFTDNITFLEGDSGSGKTYIVKFLTETKLSHKIKVFNYTDAEDKEDIKILLRTKQGYLFVFDNADLLLDDDIRRLIRIDKQNQFLIIGRDPEGLLLRERNFKVVKFENNTFSLVSPYED